MRYDLMSPVDPDWVSTWDAHHHREPPSKEPGCDYGCAVGTPVHAAADGIVRETYDGIGPATGRFIATDIDGGGSWRDMHLLRRLVGVGDRVTRGQVIAYSGASGYGYQDWSYIVAPPHVHRSLFSSAWVRAQATIGDTLDPQRYSNQNPSGGASGGGSSNEEDDMSAEAERMIQELHTKLFNGTQAGGFDVSLVDRQFVATLDVQNKLSIPGAGYGIPEVLLQRADAILQAVTGPDVDMPALLKAQAADLKASWATALDAALDEHDITIRAAIASALADVGVPQERIDAAVSAALSEARIVVSR